MAKIKTVLASLDRSCIFTIIYKRKWRLNTLFICSLYLVFGNLSFMPFTNQSFLWFFIVVLWWAILWNSLKIISALSGNRIFRVFLLFPRRGCACKTQGRIIDVVQRFHAWSKVNISERRLLQHIAGSCPGEHLRLRSRWLIILTDVGRSISVTVLAVPVAKWRACKERGGRRPTRRRGRPYVSFATWYQRATLFYSPSWKRLYALDWICAAW